MSRRMVQKRINDEQRSMVTQHLSLALKVANLFARKLPRWLSRDDLRQEAVLGLMRAAHDFDPAYGVAFGTYAGPKIKGAIFDWLRRQDHLKRIHRQELQRQGLEHRLEQLDPDLVVPTVGPEPIPESATLLKIAMRPLCRDERDIAWRCFGLGQTQAQIAEARGCNASTVSQRLPVIIEAMRRSLENHPHTLAAHMEGR
jgi:RNA polymerase sigma factor (sigma-70 family)